MGNHPDDQVSGGVISAENLNLLWLWADAELRSARAALDQETNYDTTGDANEPS